VRDQEVRNPLVGHLLREAASAYANQ